MSCRRNGCTLTTRRCRCWIPAAARPKRDGCGAMCVMISHSPVRRHRRCCIATVRTGRGSTRGAPGRVPGHPAGGRLRGIRRPVCRGVTEAACWAHARRKFFDVHAGDTVTAGVGSVATHRGAVCDRSDDARPVAPMHAWPLAPRRAHRCSPHCGHGWTRPRRASRARATWPAPSAIRCRAGRH